jgi:hypothetical protein
MLPATDAHAFVLLSNSPAAGAGTPVVLPHKGLTHLLLLVTFPYVACLPGKAGCPTCEPPADPRAAS